MFSVSEGLDEHRLILSTVLNQFLHSNILLFFNGGKQILLEEGHTNQEIP